LQVLPQAFANSAKEHLLGHDRLTTTERYLNLSPEDATREFLEKW